MKNICFLHLAAPLPTLLPPPTSLPRLPRAVEEQSVCRTQNFGADPEKITKSLRQFSSSFYLLLLNISSAYYPLTMDFPRYFLSLWSWISPNLKTSSSLCTIKRRLKGVSKVKLHRSCILDPAVFLLFAPVAERYCQCSELSLTSPIRVVMYSITVPSWQSLKTSQIYQSLDKQTFQTFQTFQLTFQT